MIFLIIAVTESARLPRLRTSNGPPAQARGAFASIKKSKLLRSATQIGASAAAIIGLEQLVDLLYSDDGPIALLLLLLLLLGIVFLLVGIGSIIYCRRRQTVTKTRRPANPCEASEIARETVELLVGRQRSSSSSYLSIFQLPPFILYATVSHFNDFLIVSQI